MKPASRAADSATNIREAADFETPDPGGAGTSPSGSRTARPNRRVDTLISIRFIAQRPSQSSFAAVSQLGIVTSRPSLSRHGAALLCGISTPSLPAQGGQRRPLQKFNRTSAKPGIAKSVRIGRAVLFPQQQARHAAAAQLLLDISQSGVGRRSLCEAAVGA